VNKQIAMEWVEALRSGKYEQGEQYLNKDNRFCCLGVLCDILPVEKNILENNIISYGAYRSITLLKKDVMNYTDISDHFGRPADFNVTINGNCYQGLSSANDQGVPFSDIADWIEANYEKL